MLPFRAIPPSISSLQFDSVSPAICSPCPAGPGRRPRPCASTSLGPRFLTQSLEGLSPVAPHSPPGSVPAPFLALPAVLRPGSHSQPCRRVIAARHPLRCCPSVGSRKNAAQAMCPHRAAIRSSAAPDVPKKEAHQAVTKGKNQRYEPLEECAMPRLSKKRRRGNYRRAFGHADRTVCNKELFCRAFY